MYGFYINILSTVSTTKAAQLALKIFSTPRRGRILDYQQEFVNTARQQRITFDDGLYMLYHWKGSGPTVLLNHGWESNSYRWKYMLNDLQQHNYNIIAIDAPAHGNTDGTEFTAIKYSKIIKSTIDLYQPNIIIAHSVGAMATVYTLSQHPSTTVNKLVLLGSPNALEDIINSYQQLLGFNNKVYNYLNKLIKDNFGFFIQEFQTQNFAQHIDTPTLILHEQNDPLIPASASKNIASNMPQAQCKITTTGGHSLHTPENTQHIIKFITK